MVKLEKVNQEKVVYLVNPKAGKLSIKQKKKIISKINSNKKPDIIFTKTSAESSSLARYYMKRKALVIACGGDGMINLIAQQAIETSSIIGILPFGRGNDFARSLGINSIKKAIENLKGDKVSNCRYLNLEFSNSKKIALTCAGVGLLSEAAYRATKIPLLKGSLLYALSALICFINLKNHCYSLTVNGKTKKQEALILAGAASPYTGGGMFIAPDAAKRKNELNLLYAGGLRRLDAIKLLLKVFSGSHIEHPAVTNTHTKNFKVEAASKNRWSSIVSGDGEYLGDLPVQISLGIKPLKVIK